MYMADSRSGVTNLSAECDILEAVESALSHERLSVYLEEPENDRKSALRLHVWNTAVSAALYGPLQGLEITLRNAMNRELVKKHGRAWYDNMDDLLDKGALERIKTAKGLKPADLNDNASQIVANLSFGFWVALAGRGGPRNDGYKANYDKMLWRPTLRWAFRNRDSLSRHEAYGSLNGLRNLRNRIAHHKPIFVLDLEKYHQNILELASWICPSTAEWIKQHSRVLELLQLRDGTGKISF